MQCLSRLPLPFRSLPKTPSFVLRFSRDVILATILLAFAGLPGARAQQTNPPPATPPQQNVPPAPPADQSDQGPADTNGTIAIPKKNPDEAPPPPPPEPKIKNPAGLENYSLRVDVPVVNVDVGVLLEKTHQFVPNLQQANFRIYEDGTPQKLIHFGRTQAPITAVLLCEFASTNYNFIYDMRNAAYSFAQQLKPDDYVAVVTYDMHTQVLTDFTQDKRVVMQALNTLMIPGFSETNEFDALYETLDRLTRVDGHKYIILVTSGIDTFSKITLDKILAKVKTTPNVTIFAVGTGQAAQLMGRARSGGMFGPKQIDYLQAQNELNTFARMTGGQAFFPRFEAEMPEIFEQINSSIRNQYLLQYSPTNPRQDGSYRKIRVELVDAEGKPLQMQDEKHHNLKYDIVARDGYRAKKEVE
jgi:VWFA-related protein